jgi:hypothetical protein
MKEEVSTGFGLQPSHELACSTTQRLFGALSAFAQKGLEHAVGRLDRIEVRHGERELGLPAPVEIAARFCRISTLSAGTSRLLKNPWRRRVWNDSLMLVCVGEDCSDARCR